ncbi:MAG: alpha/beta fold hydrolase [Anaerolineae bacterium]
MAESSPRDFDAMADAWQRAIHEAQRRALRGSQIVADSYTVPVGPTPRELVWSLNKSRLYRYHPAAPQQQPARRTPLLLVYALINKPYIFDLHAEVSFIAYMLARGFDVYLLDWGAPGPEDRHTRFDDYATEYLPRAVRKMLRVSGAHEFSMMGYCIGGTLSVLYAALHPAAPLRNLLLLASPLDFSQRDSIFANWFDDRFFNIDSFVDRLPAGLVPAELVEMGGLMLKPVDNYVGTYAMLWERLDSPDSVTHWQAVHRWVHDSVPFAGEAFRQWVKDYIRANELIDSRHVAKGVRADLANITASFFNIVAEHDHIVPPSHSTTIMGKIGSTDKQQVIAPSGHVGLMCSRSAKRTLWPQIAGWLAERSA